MPSSAAAARARPASDDYRAVPAKQLRPMLADAQPFGESKSIAKPFRRLADIGVFQDRDDDGGWHGAVFTHCARSTCGKLRLHCILVPLQLQTLN